MCEATTCMWVIGQGAAVCCTSGRSELAFGNPAVCTWDIRNGGAFMWDIGQGAVCMRDIGQNATCTCLWYMGVACMWAGYATGLFVLLGA